jgi:hypothetical protein
VVPENDAVPEPERVPFGVAAEHVKGVVTDAPDWAELAEAVPPANASPAEPAIATERASRVVMLIA